MTIYIFIINYIKLLLIIKQCYLYIILYKLCRENKLIKNNLEKKNKNQNFRNSSL